MSNAHEKARLGFVGLGEYAETLAKASQACENIEIAACFTRTPAKRRRFAETFGCREIDSFEALCAADDLDGVVLVTPNDVHADQTIALSEAGKHVFVEKPICNTLDEADRMIVACAKAGVVLAVGHQMRRCGVYRKWKEILTNGELGEVLFFEANHCGDLVRVWPEDDWRFHAQRGSGPLIHKGIHKLDLLSYFFGEAESVITMARPLAFNPEVNETTVSAFRFANGVIGSFTSGFRYNHNTISLIGSEQSVFYSGYGDAFTLKNERTWEQTQVTCPHVDEIRDEMWEFAQAVLGRVRYEVDGAEARRALRLAIGARKAARTNMPFNFNSKKL